jgi:hypothetical protein
MYVSVSGELHDFSERVERVVAADVVPFCVSYVVVCCDEDADCVCRGWASVISEGRPRVCPFAVEARGIARHEQSTKQCSCQPENNRRGLAVKSQAALSEGPGQV